jgi:hypothetical protein
MTCSARRAQLRLFVLLIVGVSFFVRNAEPGGQALADTTDTILAGCDLPAKASLRADVLCTLFADRLAAALAGRAVEAAPEGAAASVRLVVLAAAPGRVEARIDWAGAAPGPALGTARADAALDEVALTAFLDRLIAETPVP